MKQIRINYGLILIILLNIILFVLYYGKFGMFFVDTSRETYIPMAMNKGFLLYKDIFNVYAPFGYQINALLFKIFAGHLKALYFAGFINSIMILCELFVILKLFLKNNKIICSILFMITSACFYTVSLTNYIFPYSYSMIYALNAFLLSLISILRCLINGKNLFLYLAFFFLGTSIIIKYEFTPFILLLFAVLIFKKIKLKNIIISLLFFSLIPFLSIFNLILQGVNFYDFFQAFIYSIQVGKSESTLYLYKFLGFIPTLHSFKNLFINFIIFLIFIMGIYLIVCKFSMKNKKLNIFKNFICFIVFYYLLFPFFVESNAFYFNWIGVLNAILLFIFIYYFFKNKTEHINIIFLVLFLSTVLVSFKSIFNISFNSYGSYYFPLLFICCIIFFCIYSEKIFNVKIRENFILYLILLVSCLFLTSNYARRNYIFNYDVYTEKGKISVPYNEGIAINQTLNYINNNTNGNDKILVLPEGSMINFLTNRLSDNKYYYLIPNNIEVFKENKIVNDLEQDLPDYLILQSMSYTNFNHTFFCESFGRNICGLIPKYYEAPVVFNNKEGDFWLAVYKLKKENKNDKENK